MVTARRYRVHGLVQGVGFRMFVVDQARLEGLHGWVRNRDDGSVEVEAEGDREALERFARHLARGPRGAEVRDVTTDDIPPTGRASGFTIRR